MSKLVEELRFQGSPRTVQPAHDLMLRAADEIERLKKELREERADRADERRNGGNYWGDMIGQDIEG